MAAIGRDKIMLLIEDSPTQSMHFKALLERAGMRCQVASNGQTGAYLAQALMPCLIVLDWELPRMNGLQVCQMLKADPATRDIPVIILTYHAESEVAPVLESGVRYVSKGAFADTILLTTVQEIVAS